MPVLSRCAIAEASILSIALLGPVSSASAEEFDVEFPEGDFCPGFAVLGSITVKSSEKTLPGDRLWGHAVGDGVWTNAETGQTFTQRSRYASVETYDAATNDIHVTVNGRYFFGTYAGDMGPTGLATETQTFSVAGHQTFTIDLDTNKVIAYSLDGVILADICAVLAGEG